MKEKKFVAAVLVFSLIGGITLGESVSSYTFRCGDFSSMLTSSDVGLVDITAVPDADTAVTIATSIAESSHLVNSSSETSVFLDESSKVWIVAFDENPTEIGGELYIALNMSNAQVVRIWFEE